MFLSLMFLTVTVLTNIWHSNKNSWSTIVVYVYCKAVFTAASWSSVIKLYSSNKYKGPEKVLLHSNGLFIQRLQGGGKFLYLMLLQRFNSWKLTAAAASTLHSKTFSTLLQIKQLMFSQTDEHFNKLNVAGSSAWTVYKVVLLLLRNYKCWGKNHQQFKLLNV